MNIARTKVCPTEPKRAWKSTSGFLAIGLRKRLYFREGIATQRNATIMDNFSEYIACTYYDTILFGWICDASINEDKAFRFLKDLKTEFAKLYKGDLDKVHKQQNIKPMWLDKFFKSSFIKIFDNYRTGINQKNLQLAFVKAEEVKQIASTNVKSMVKNIQETDQLLDKSQNIKDLAKDFEKNASKMEQIQRSNNFWFSWKNANEMEQIQRSSNFWLCSKKWLLIFGGIGLGVFIIYLVQMFA